jgi:hypothetical protein
MFQFNPFTGTLDLNAGPGSYADDVVEYPNRNAFPVPGEQEKLYVDKSTDRAYRWPENGTNLNSYREVSASEVTSAELSAVQSNLSNIAGTAYKSVTQSDTITANFPTSGNALFGGYARATDWQITFNAARTVDFYFNNNPNNVTGVTNFPILGDYVNVTLSGSATPWTANFKRPDGTLLLAVTSADSDLKKTNLRFVYDGTSWVIDRTVWNPSLQSALDSKQPTGNYVTRTDVQSGGSSYFERSADAASQNIGQGQSVHQLVLANDTRLADARRVQWFTAPPNFYTVPNGATAGAMAYDGSFLYLLVPYGPTSLRWARSPMTTTW